MKTESYTKSTKSKGLPHFEVGLFVLVTPHPVPLPRGERGMKKGNG